MRKSTSILLTILLISSLVAPVLADSASLRLSDATPTALNFSSFSKTAGFHFDFVPASSIWKDMLAGQAPAKLKANYTLRDNVIQVGSDFDKNIKSATQLMIGSSTAHTPAMRIVSNGAFISKPILESVAGTSQMIQPDTVFVNEETGTAFKVVVAMDGDGNYEKLKDHYAVAKPQIHEVVNDFRIPSSDIELNKANITSFAGLPNNPISSVENYIVKSATTVPLSTMASPLALNSIKDPLIQFEFPEGTELNATSGGQNIKVKISGGLGVGNLGLEAKYSGFDGYYFALKIAEEAYLNVDVGINTNKEIRIPILGIDVPFGIGRVSGGLFNDDPKDLYSRDMLYVSGAEYVKYDLVIEFMADDERYVIREFDNSPCNDHHARPMTEEEKQAIEDSFKNRGLFIEYDRFHFGPDIESRLDVNIIDDLMDQSVFDYGSVIGAISSLRKGSLTLGLGGETGTVVPGKVFNALKDNAAQTIGLILRQEGATITFMSGSVDAVDSEQRFDFAFSNQAVSGSTMKAAAGQTASSFTFAFAHNNKLPGFARFDIVTDLAAGQNVNVYKYKYDTQSQLFSVVAENVTVADEGVVSFMNDTMSEYLITTAKLNNTVMTDAYRMNNQTGERKPVIWLFYAGGGFLLVLAGITIVVLILRKKKRNV